MAKGVLVHVAVLEEMEQDSKNFTVGDIVLMYEDNVVRSRWPMARVVGIEKGQDALVRGLQLKTDSGKIFRRPVQKVVLLLEA